MPTLCNYLQETAGRHADRLGVSIFDLEPRGLTWVLARLHVRLVELPGWQGPVEVETWPSGSRGYYATRDFLALDAEGAEVARATSRWMVLDRERRRPVRLPRDVAALPVPRRPRALPGPSLQLPRLERPGPGRSFAVRRRDLDVNAHVNHVRYLEWALEALPPSFADGHRPRELEADFRSELHYSQSVMVQAGEPRTADGQTELRFLLTVEGQTAEKEAEAARLCFRWASEVESPVSADPGASSADTPPEE